MHWIIKPQYWLMLEKYSKEVDEQLNYELDTFLFHFHESNYTVTLGSTNYWIGNYPYSYAIPYTGICSTIKSRPSRRTIQRFHKRYLEDLALYKQDPYEYDKLKNQAIAREAAKAEGKEG